MTHATERAPTASAEHRTVSRVMDILERVVASEPLGLRLGDLAEALEAPKSSVHALTKGLLATGYLRERGGRYFQGPAVHSLLSSGAAPQIPPWYLQALEQLTAAWNETAVLSTLVGDAVVHVAAVESPHTIRATPPMHQRRPLWPISSGKCLLAFRSPRRQESYLRSLALGPEEERRVVAELAEIRQTTVAVNRTEELLGVSSPILAGDTDPTWAIGLIGPAPRMAPTLTEIAANVLEVARSLSTDR